MVQRYDLTSIWAKVVIVLPQQEILLLLENWQQCMWQYYNVRRETELPRFSAVFLKSQVTEKMCIFIVL
jgi:hypothetical protein